LTGGVDGGTPGAADPAPACLPFRFVASMPVLGRDVGAWRDALARIEGLGYHAVSISDHVIGGWSMDALTALAAAAMVTTRLRLRTQVLANDYRHPVLVHRAAASIDVLSGGRLELGLGTGWWRAEYAALGLDLDAPAVRVARLAETLDLLDGLFAGGPVDHAGPAYRVRGVTGLPAPVQVPRPPILVGGGSPGILRLAARRADIVGILPTRGPEGTVPMDGLHPAAQAARTRLVREAAIAAGRDPARIPLQASVLGFVLDLPGGRRQGASSILPPGALDDPGALAGPFLVRGDEDAAAERIVAWRDAYGISDIHVGSDAVAFGGIVERLTRT
jgi:probable F420-dependent oxidoreductase